MTSAYILLITLYLTEGGTLEAECDTRATTQQECSLIAKEHEDVLRKEFSIAKEEKGMCPFKEVKIRCYKPKTR